VFRLGSHFTLVYQIGDRNTSVRLALADLKAARSQEKAAPGADLTEIVRN